MADDIIEFPTTEVPSLKLTGWAGEAAAFMTDPCAADPSHQHHSHDDDDEYEKVNDIKVPVGVLLLEPRTLYDKALIGVARQGGVHYAVYSETLALAATVTDSIDDAAAAIRDGADPDEDADPEVDGIEHFEFNVSGSIGPGYPVFMLDDES